MQIILASTSAYRRRLLERLGLTFICEPPQVDEKPQNGETPQALVRRLARAKAQAVSAQYPDSVVIGSDQVAALDGAIIGKPGNHACALAQLTALSGRRVFFFTGLCVLDTRTQHCQEHLDQTCVRFRSLSATEIERYLKVEQPYNCAGSFKSEGLGISLFEAIESEDPTALVGMPLIALCHFLREAGVVLP
ncbi:MAG: Maf family nucleotide pyrophosphatase [Gammaproteobacteria bacterium]